MNYCKTDEKREFFEEEIKEIEERVEIFIEVRLEDLEDFFPRYSGIKYSRIEKLFYEKGMNDVKRKMKEEIKKTLKWYG